MLLSGGLGLLLLTLAHLCIDVIGIWNGAPFVRTRIAFVTCVVMICVALLLFWAVGRVLRMCSE